MLKADSTKHAFELSQQMLELGGLGHSAAIHTQNDALAEKFGKK